MIEVFSGFSALASRIIGADSSPLAVRSLPESIAGAAAARTRPTLGKWANEMRSRCHWLANRSALRRWLQRRGQRLRRQTPTNKHV